MPIILHTMNEVLESLTESHDYLKGNKKNKKTMRKHLRFTRVLKSLSIDSKDKSKLSA